MKSFLLSLFVFTSVLGSASAQNSKDLVLRMLFNGDVKDASTYKNHGTAQGGITFGEDRFGSKCGAIEFNGRDAYVSIPSTKSLESPTKAVTIVTWVKVNAGSGNLKWLTICCKGNDTTESPNCPQYRLQGTAVTLSLNTEFTENLKLNMDFDTWYHYAMTYDGATVFMYLNGASVFSYKYSGSLVSNTMPLEIGRDMPGVMEYFNGSLDDLQIYNRALSAADIVRLYQDNSEKSSPKPCTVVPPPPVVLKKPTPNPKPINPVIPPKPQQTTVVNPSITPIVTPKQPVKAQSQPQAVTPTPQPTAAMPTPQKTGNKPFIILSKPYNNKNSETEVKDELCTVIAKVINVTSDKQIKCVLNGDDYPFTFDPNTQYLETKLNLLGGSNVLEIFASNEFGNSSASAGIALIEEKPAPKPIEKPIAPIVQDNISEPIAPILKNDKIEIKHNVKLTSNEITIACYDHQTIDGDVVTVLLNQDILFDKIELQAKDAHSAEKKLVLQPNKSYSLIVKTINEGKVPTNTLQISISDKNGFHKIYTLTSQKGTSQGLKLVYNPPTK